MASLFSADALAALRATSDNGAGSSATPPQEKGRRTALYGADSVQLFMLNPWGCSVLDEADDATLWSACAKGNKVAAYHTELAATDPYRLGVGISKTAQVLVEAIEKLQNDRLLQLLLKEEPYQRAVDEGTALLPWLKRLNAGPGVKDNAETQSLSAVKKRLRATSATPPAPTHTAEEAKTATEHFVAWLKKESSALRDILEILGAAGVMWSAHAAERTARAWLKCKPEPDAAILEAVRARAATGEAPAKRAKTDVGKGLFQE